MSGKKGYSWELRVCATSGGTYKVVGKGSDVDLSPDSDELDVSVRDGAGWKDVEQGLKSWKSSVQHLWVPADEAYVILQAAFFSGDPVFCQFTEAAFATSTAKGFDGNGIVKTLGIPQKLNGAVFVAIELVGKGALTPVTRT